MLSSLTQISICWNLLNFLNMNVKKKGILISPLEVPDKNILFEYYSPIIANNIL